MIRRQVETIRRQSESRTGRELRSAPLRTLPAALLFTMVSAVAPATVGAQTDVAPAIMARTAMAQGGVAPAVPAVPALAVQPDGREILDRAIDAHGGERYENTRIRFDFRGDLYTVTRRNGLFRYERSYRDDQGGEVLEVLTNDSLYRAVDGERVSLSEGERSSMLTTVNSVVYFALLPQPLGDPAVIPRYLDETQVRGEPYHKVEVTFQEEGGGEDWEDRFVYWIHREDHTVDYLAYRFHTGYGGTRFREAYNRRDVGGIVFQDYRNYTGDEEAPIETYDRDLEEGELELVSDVALETVEVEALED